MQTFRVRSRPEGPLLSMVFCVIVTLVLVLGVVPALRDGNPARAIGLSLPLLVMGIAY